MSSNMFGRQRRLHGPVIEHSDMRQQQQRGEQKRGIEMKSKESIQFEFKKMEIGEPTFYDKNDSEAVCYSQLKRRIYKEFGEKIGKGMLQQAWQDVKYSNQSKDLFSNEMIESLETVNKNDKNNILNGFSARMINDLSKSRTRLMEDRDGDFHYNQQPYGAKWNDRELAITPTSSDNDNDSDSDNDDTSINISKVNSNNNNNNNSESDKKFEIILNKYGLKWNDVFCKDDVLTSDDLLNSDLFLRNINSFLRNRVLKDLRNEKLENDKNGKNGNIGNSGNSGNNGKNGKNSKYKIDENVKDMMVIERGSKYVYNKDGTIASQNDFNNEYIWNESKTMKASKSLGYRFNKYQYLYDSNVYSYGMNGKNSQTKVTIIASIAENENDESSNNNKVLTEKEWNEKRKQDKKVARGGKKNKNKKKASSKRAQSNDDFFQTDQYKAKMKKNNKSKSKK